MPSSSHIPVQNQLCCINRVCKRGNFLGHRLDIFRESLPAFKKSVKSTRNAGRC